MCHIFLYTILTITVIIRFLLGQQTKMCGNHQPTHSHQNVWESSSSVVGGNKMARPGLQLENRFLGPIPGLLNLNLWASEFLTKHYLD